VSEFSANGKMAAAVHGPALSDALSHFISLALAPGLQRIFLFSFLRRLSSPKIEFASRHEESEPPPRCFRLSSLRVVPMQTCALRKKRQNTQARNMSSTFREVQNGIWLILN
jgi:hypothetical protein